MSARKPIAWAVIAVGAVASVAASPAVAAEAPKKATLLAVGGPSLKVNRYFQDGNRFNKDSVTIRSGGTLTVRSRNPEPHSFSLLTRKDMPTTLRKGQECFEGGPCVQLAGAHGMTEHGGEPTTPLVNVGLDGFDRPGDSALFGRDPVRLKITAKAGTNLHYLCIFHPQMQGRVKVR